MARFLYQQCFWDPHFAYCLASWKPPNLLTALEYQAGTAGAADIIEFAANIEALAQSLGHGKAFAQVERIRNEAAKEVTGWSHAIFEAANVAIDRLSDAVRLGETVVAAE